MKALKARDPIAYAIMSNVTGEEKPAPKVVQPETRVIKIAVSPTETKETNAAVFTDLVALHVDTDRIALTHVPTGYLIFQINFETRQQAKVLTDAYLKLLAVVVPFFTEAKGIYSDKPKIAAKQLKPLAKLLQAIGKCWCNSQLEKMVGAFWADRMNVENALVDLGLPRTMASQFADANNF